MFTFKKAERLNSYKLIKKLIDSSDCVLSSLMKCTFLKLGNNYCSKYNIKVLIKIPKKKIKNATERNLIKRRIREAFRTNKHLLTNTTGKTILIQIEYLLVKNTSYYVLEKDLQKIFQEIKILI